MQPGILDSRAKRLIQTLASWPADKYASEILIPTASRVVRAHALTPGAVREALISPENALRLLLGHYAIFRRGQDRDVLSRMMLRALDRTIEGSDFMEFMASCDSESLWLSYEEICADEGRRSLEQSNRPVIEGIAGLGFEIHEEFGHANIVEWLRNEISETHRCESAFDRLVQIRTLGPKTASTILRDVVYLYDLEATVDYSDRLLLQPINTVVREAAQVILAGDRAEEYADWILAGKVAKAIRYSGESGVQFSMGCAYLAGRSKRSGRDGVREILTGICQPDH